MSDALNPSETAELLAEAVERNAPIELRRYIIGGDTVALRSRLLSMDDEHLFAELPVASGAPPLAFNDQVDVYLMLGGESYRFRSRVVDLRCRLPLNAGKTVPAMSLDRPAAATRQQRREDFRVALAGAQVLPVELHVVHADRGFACPVATPRMWGTMNNLSLGGAALRLEASAMSSLANGSLYFLGFLLPGDARGMLFLTELRYHRSILNGEAIVAGVKFRSCPHIPMTAQIERLGHFIADVQRQGMGR